ncbi:MAG: NADH-quinone oxidoreductase subunit M [Armatimonadota bacterium]
MFIRDNILSILIFLPVAASIMVLLIPRRFDALIRWFSLAAAVVTFAIAVPLFFWFDLKTTGMQFQQVVPWVKTARFAINYHVGIDGISLFLVLLTTFLVPVAMLASWRSITDHAREFYFSLLILLGAMIGVFVSLDLILFYVFWDAMLILMYFIIGVWGYQNRIYASIKFFIYTLVGSLLMLVAIIYLGFQNPTGVTFDLLELTSAGPIARNIQFWLFGAFGLAFAIKIPIFPLHTWLPDAHTEAPTAGSVILAGILLKMGAYGFLRFCLPLFPLAAVYFAPLLIVLGIIGIIYGALVAFAQPDVKRLVAYSSVSHLGFVVMGIFAFNIQGIQGALLLMIAHGLATGAMFLVVGILYDRRHSRLMADFGGVWKVMPVLGGFFMLAALASLGLPGLSNFPGEFLVVVGTFLARNWIYAALTASGVVLSTIYILWLYGNVMQGPTEKPAIRSMRDLTVREIFVLTPVILFIILLGAFPGTVLSRTEASAGRVMEAVRNREQVRGNKEQKLGVKEVVASLRANPWTYRITGRSTSFHQSQKLASAQTTRAEVSSVLGLSARIGSKQSDAKNDNHVTLNLIQGPFPPRHSELDSEPIPKLIPSQARNDVVIASCFGLLAAEADTAGVEKLNMLRDRSPSRSTVLHQSEAYLHPVTSEEKGVER